MGVFAFSSVSHSLGLAASFNQNIAGSGCFHKVVALCASILEHTHREGVGDEKGRILS